jgi:pimeloyl-ACP methyl ester carboxylesterase
MRVDEFPIFVPHRGGHLAAVVTVPESEPRGLVLMLPGASLDEEVGSYLLFARAAARFSDLGFASVRLDYFGLGESTQDAEAWPLGAIEPALEQANAVLDAARRGLGSSRFGILALCYGGHVALSLSARADCVGALCLAPPLIEKGRWTERRQRYGRMRVVSAIKAHKRLRRMILRPLRRAFSERRPTSLVQNALDDLEDGRILVLYGEREVRRSHLRQHATRSLQRMAANAAGRQGRFAVELTPTQPLAAFDAMPETEQELVLERVVSWLAACFDVSEPAPRPADRPERVRTQAAT